MIRGTTLFICTKCKKVFLAPDVEYDAMAYSVPMPCERCGSMHTMPLQISVFSESDELNPNKPLEKQLWDYSIYKSIWERMGSNGCVEQANTPDEQFRIGMSYLDGTSWSCHSSDVALYWLMKAAKQGHVQAQYQVGVLLRGRKPVPRYLQEPPFCYSEGTAYEWIRKAAGQGLPEALCYLGNHRAEDLEKAVAWYQKAVASGCCAGSEYAIACMYGQGEEGGRNTFRALRWCWKATLHGYTDAQLRLGTIYESTAKERHLHITITLYRQAAQQKPIEAWLRLASLYENDKGKSQDFLKAWECYQKAWEAGSEEAYKKAKRLLDEGRANPEISAVKEWYRKCIAKGHNELWYDLGKLYDEGKEGERDVKEAFQCYLIAARTAHVSEAQYVVACMYEQGEGVQSDLHEAVHWYKEAAKQGHQKSAEICQRLALLYETGKGVEQDFQEAWECYMSAWDAGSEQAYKKMKRLWDEGQVNLEIATEKEWCRKWIAQGHRELWYDLGKLYDEGKEGERDVKEAFQCYLIAARTAHVAEAQYAVACMYEQGEGVQPDLREAIHWYKEAAKQGHVQAQAACRRLEEQ